MDLDDFRTINDTIGHVAGDDLLKDVAVAELPKGAAHLARAIADRLHRAVTGWLFSRPQPLDRLPAPVSAGTPQRLLTGRRPR